MKRLGICGIALLTMFGAGQAYGQAPPPAAPPAASQDQAQQGVGRISLIHGDVSMQRGDSGDWVAATLNTPVVTGDKVSTGQSSRTEVQLDYANILRLSDQSQAKVAGLERTRIQVQLGQGLAFYTVFKGTEADVEIDTPNVAVHPRSEGEFRIQVSPSGETVAPWRPCRMAGSSRHRPRRSVPDGRCPIQGRLGSMERRPRQNDPERRDLGPRRSLLYRRARSGCLRALDRCPRLWLGLVPDGGRRLGALSRGQLGLGALLRLDLGVL